jgi:hypothetical protein
LVPVEELDLRCPMYGPIITSDCKVKGCCSSLLALGDRNPLILGDVSQDGLATIVENAGKHQYYNFLKSFGLVPIVSLLRTSEFSAVLEQNFTDVCHLCHEIHADTQVREFLTHKFESNSGNGEASHDCSA